MRLRMLIVATVLPLGALLLSAPAPAMPPQSETRQAELPKPLVIPEADRKKTNPVPNVKAAIDSGRNLFSSQCTMCHGAQGTGRGDLAISLKMNMPDLTDPKLHRKRTDGDLFYIISLGHGQMPGETRLIPANRWEMIRYIRTLKRIGER